MAHHPNIRIPKRYLSGIASISKLTEDEINSIYDILRQVPKGVNHKKFIDLLTESLKLKNVKEIANSIFGMGSLILNKDTNVEELALGIFDSLNQEKEFTIENYEVDLLKERLKFILTSIDNLKPIYQVYNIVSDSDVLRYTDIFTDVRTFFDDDSKISNSVIFHELKIGYTSDDKFLNSKLLLDKDDLLKLRSQISAALLMEENIKEKNHSSLNFLEIEFAD